MSADAAFYSAHNESAAHALGVKLLAMTVGQLGLALWEGGESRLGDTAWRGVDSEIIGAVSSEVLKRTFTRTRPSNAADPNRFFASDSNHSFPSGEAAEAASIVTPYILEYGKIIRRSMRWRSFRHMSAQRG